MADGRSRPSKPPGGGSEQPTSPLRVRWGSLEGSRRTILIVSALCLCVVVAGVGIALLSSPGGQAGHVAATSSTAPATATTTPPASPAASSRATSGPKVKSEGAGTIALGWPPRLNRQILRWKAGQGGKALVAVEQQMGTAMQAAGIKSYATMKRACASLASEVGTAQAAPAIPYGAMQRLYAKALAGLSSAAADCRSAISEHPGDETVDIHVNQALLSQSRLEFAAMSKKLYRATAQIQSAHR